MPGRQLMEEEWFEGSRLGEPVFVRRREVLRETLDALAAPGALARYRRLAATNLERWRRARTASPPRGRIVVLPGDWGAVAGALTREHGECFAVLNMANPLVPGGGYVEGMAAQEENLFRRTDCHLSIGEDALVPGTERYRDEMIALLSAEHGRVYLDTETPRVCLRGPEDIGRPDLGYAWLADEEVFPFFELRAAADDRRDGHDFDREGMRARIAAQLATLEEAEVRFAVLGAFGCGAFGNPGREVARLYRECIGEAGDSFALFAFAIFHAGYGPGNFAPFAEVLGGQ